MLCQLRQLCASGALKMQLCRYLIETLHICGRAPSVLFDRKHGIRFWLSVL